ncbi:NAD dependent epimerase/dehydratase family protein [Aspergillus sclerotioniger CBS 115572]|uniref:NAD dependent epimerase/dehydratase family protein n=1 Tax=Aspergillus sclerotioniger CBS 115572 TaxID=1450535 RepID=A0A317XC06_9EURO|nr:NAD dependent epimerase/dehydratase family protein [Aspergillus sclerotioniger CBS 115572]PWY96174.1 NAD dependent epimerase/dehydratase family protein [Aspergillus sclerotioniger CBS 115572]
MAKIFLTGASGYIGGDVLYALKTAFPDCNYTALLRDEQKAQAISKDYPDLHIILGDLDSSLILEEQAREADIVVHTASSNHIKSAEAIVRGLTAPGRSKPGHWIQISGASVLSIPDIEKNAFGEASANVYNDLEGADELRSLIERYSAKRIVDNFILSLSANRLKTALVFPPIIYGRGRGSINQRSIQIPELARVIMQRREGVQVGKGESTWSNVHVSDVSSIFVKLVEKALQGEDRDLWNEHGLYFPGNGNLVSSYFDSFRVLLIGQSFGAISARVAQEVKNLGLSDSTSVIEISHEEADSLTPHGGVLWGTNAQQVAQRARQYLGWVPAGRTLEEEIPATVLAEAQRLGLK